MKKVSIAACFLVLSFFAKAQVGAFNLPNYKKFKLPEVGKPQNPLFLDKNKIGKILQSTKLLNNYNSKLILPLDNMPCFIPDISTVCKIPNNQSTGFAIPIPNSFTQVK